MIRQHVIPRWLRGERHFHWRGGDVSRIEALSDMVFAFSLTLLVVSLEVPRTFGELWRVILQFPAFAACFAFFLWVWYLHYRFHRRFGLENHLTVLLNGALLFVVVFYVYPLKFVATLVVNQFFGLETGAGAVAIEGDQWRPLMLFYSCGFIGIFLVFTLMNVYAYRHRVALDLDEAERYQTSAEIRAHLLSVGVGSLSLVLTLLGGGYGWLAGVVFFLMGPAHGIHGYLTGRRVGRIVDAGSPS